MEDLAAAGRDNDGADTETSNDDVQVVRQNKGKSKEGKGKCISGDLSGDSPIPSPSAATHGRHYHVLDSLEMLVSRKKSSSNSMSVSIRSLPKNQPASSKAKSYYEVALAQLLDLRLPWEVHVKMDDILKNEQEQFLWFMARCDEDWLSLVRMRYCFPSE